MHGRYKNESVASLILCTMQLGNPTRPRDQLNTSALISLFSIICFAREKIMNYTVYKRVNMADCLHRNSLLGNMGSFAIC